MQQFCLVSRSSSDGGGGTSFGLFFLPIPAKKHLSFSWFGLGPRLGDRLFGGVGTVIAAATGSGDGTEQDHYVVLGIHRAATAAEVKHAYRRLAREHHPDVSRNQRAGEFFKRIRLAYEVLSDEGKRARYDLMHETPIIANKSRHPKYDDKRIYRCEELRGMRKKTPKKSNQTEAYQNTSSYKRGRSPFIKVLQFAFTTLIFVWAIGCRASLTLSGISALLDKQLDAGYKMGYVIAWILGGRPGILLTLCLFFSSWLCGKKSSGIVALMVVAMWVGANITRFLPLPAGAVLTLMYMSMKLQVDSK